MDAFIQAFEEALDLPAGSVNAQTRFKELAEWDSLAQLSVMTLIEYMYKRVVDQTVLKNSTTVGDLIQSVEAA